jgi:hypothetical protein
MAASSNEPLRSEKRLVFTRDIWITEKRGLSEARDPQTGRLLDKPGDSALPPGKALPPPLRRVLRGKKSRPHSG